MNTVNVVTVGDTGNHVIDALEELRGTIKVIRRCPELLDLLAACQSGLASVAVVAESADQLKATLVDRLTAVGVSLVAIAADPAEATRLRGIGAVAVPANPTPEAITEAVLGALNARRYPQSAGFGVPTARLPIPKPGDGDDGVRFDAGQGGAVNPPPRALGSEASRAAAAGAEAGGAASAQQVPSRGHGSSRQTGQQVGARTGSPPRGLAKVRAAFSIFPARKAAGSEGRARAVAVTAGTTVNPFSAPDGRTQHQTVAVWGPAGSPGRTTLAINLAAEWAAQGLKVLVVDADSYGASVAATLGLLDESASFAQACRVADQGLLTTAELERISSVVVFAGGTFALLTGLTRSERWPELRAAAVERVLQTAQKMVDVVVIDCGFCLESDEELSYDSVAPRRNGATLSALAQADVIFAIGNSDAIGIPRLIRALAELPEVCAGATIEVVLNKVRKKAAGTAPQKALEQAWERFGPGIPITHFLPWDADVLDRALLEGRLLSEVAPDSALRRAILKICCAPVQQNQKLLS
ncbi:hypothetical protein AOC05_10860 [Arthrobacter alpinus]|uniref:CobQ/CobB/MinD/ParA nucleotide binding domain-containing protein n=1 Tax=Arthrobacter alpinus TaxID=656366 RepID=A0A0M4QGB0_9MICC|nr:ParA family protein [Arthrobacter alpinus]ALE92692.1 hypothetical protein AOC05_10860 [Arthrobacter alpinus]